MATLRARRICHARSAAVAAGLPGPAADDRLVLAGADAAAAARVADPRRRGLFAAALAGSGGVGALAAADRPTRCCCRSRPRWPRSGSSMTSRLEPSARPAPGRCGCSSAWPHGRVLAAAVGELAATLPLYMRSLGVALLALTLAFGVDPNGSGASAVVHPRAGEHSAHRGVKLLLVMFLAAYLEDHRELLAFAGRRIRPSRCRRCRIWRPSC